MCESWKRVLASLVAGGLLTGAVRAQPTITLQPTNEVVVQGGTATFSVAVAVSGTGPFTYQWQCNGTNISPGIIRTVAGNGIAGYSRDGGQATNAELNYPYDMLVDRRGRLFIADSDNCRVRMVETNGIITTVAGTGQYGYSGDGDAATNARLGGILGVAMDNAGNLFISDSHNVIRKVDTNGIITTVANGFAVNLGISLDSDDNIFVADYNHNRVAKVDTNGTVTTVAGGGQSFPGDGGQATNAIVSHPNDVTVDSKGEMFIAENHLVCKVDTNGILTSVASANLPTSVKVEGAGNVFIADYGADRVSVVMAANGIVAVAVGDGVVGYSGDYGPATEAELNGPYGVAVDEAGDVFVADNGNSRIREVTGIPPYPVNLPTFLVTNVSMTNEGNYSVVVTGPSGCVTSSVASLTAVSPPIVSSMGMNPDGSFTLNLTTKTNTPSRVLAATEHRGSGV